MRSNALSLAALCQRYCVGPDLSLMISSRTCCQVRPLLLPHHRVSTLHLKPPSTTAFATSDARSLPLCHKGFQRYGPISAIGRYFFSD